MGKHYELKKENYLKSTDRSKLHVDVIYHFLSQESYWAKGIPLKDRLRIQSVLAFIIIVNKQVLQE